MKPIAVGDIETDPFKKFRSPQPFLAGFFDGKRVRRFWGKHCIRDSYRAMRRELRGHYIYFHNGGKFDFRYYMPYLLRDGAVLKPIKGRAARFVLPDGTEFRDSYCLLPVSLKATGQKQDIDYRKLERGARDRHRDEIIRYWEQDLFVLYEKVNEFVQEYGFGMTMAGRTFEQLKKRFDTNPPKCDEHYDKKFRFYYYGGRVEFFALGWQRGKFKVIDINSAYPAAMKKSHAFGTEFSNLRRIPKSDARAEKCFINFTGESLGGLPWRKEDGTLSFAAHRGDFAVTGWEFVAARKLGRVTVETLHECLFPLECREFGGFVDYFYRQKVTAEKGSSEQLFAKLFLNSCYGRFALNAREFRDIVTTRYGQEPDENKVLRRRVSHYTRQQSPKLRGEAYRLACARNWQRLDGKWERTNDFEDIGVSVWERKSELRSNAFFNVATAASITGCVRAYLMQSLAVVEGAVYCDTDSIICRDPGALPLGAGLGEWKLEGVSVKDGLWIAGKKLYALNLGRGKWKTASKGVRLTPQEIIQVANGETVKKTFDAPTFSIYTTPNVKGSKGDFVERTIRRDDKRFIRKKC
jgi:DNA polymerase elongation subunit (family B)